MWLGFSNLTIVFIQGHGSEWLKDLLFGLSVSNHMRGVLPVKTSKSVYLLALIILVIALVPVQAPVVQAQSSGPTVSADAQYVPGELIVGFGPGLTSADMDAKASVMAGSVDAQVAETFDSMALISLEPDADLDQAIVQLHAQIGVQYVERNYIRRVPSISRDASYAVDSIQRKASDGKQVEIGVDQLKAMRSQVKSGGRVRTLPTYPSNEWLNWGNFRIGHDIIWSERASSPWVCVADTGVDSNHPDLKGRVVNGYDFINADRVPQDDYGHGTHIAGTIVGKVGKSDGPAGISNGKVLAVKVLGAQGWGTDFDVAQGIRYCANNSYVKVINLSLGGSEPSYTTYSALQYAVNQKGKLVVVAAGNGSTSVPEFPAGWASDTINGIDVFGSMTAANDIHAGMLSVGAGVPNDYFAGYGDPFGPTWVDTNFNNLRDTGEDTYLDCAASFSNYGNWVEVAAPGASIWSTLPVSYPYYSNYYFGDGVDTPGYATWGGTSMAAAHVSGAAARLWSINRGLDNTQIQDLLISTGDPLNLAVDPSVTQVLTGFDGYGNPVDSNVPHGAAPYCWPEASGNYGAAQDMSNSVYINLAKAMDRGILTTMAFDSVTALPIQGAKIKAQDAATGKTAGIALVQASYDYPYTDLINLPATHGDSPVYNLLISHPKYTLGFQMYEFVMPVIPGIASWDPQWGIAAVPPKKSTISVVAQWWYDDCYFGCSGPTSGDIDLYLWLPDEQNTIVGPEKYWPPDYNTINPFSVTGSLVDAPYARYHRDGGYANTGDPGGLDFVNIETIEIKNRRAKPYYPGDYKIYMTNNNGSEQQLNEAFPFVTIWRSGQIIGWSLKNLDNTATTQAGYCNTDQNWWYAGSIKGSRFTPEDNCGDSSILPYWIPLP